MKRALLILGGSFGAPEGSEGLGAVADAVSHRGAFDVVLPVFLGGGIPDLREGIRQALERGAGQIVVFPYCLSLAPAAREAIRQVLAECRTLAPSCEIDSADPLDADPRVVDWVVERALAAGVRMGSGASREVLTVDGRVRHPLRLSYADLSASAGQVPDVSVVDPGRQGAGVRVGPLVISAEPHPSADRITFHSSDEGFSATVGIEEAVARGILIYRLGDGPLPDRAGGPVRLTLPGTEDACSNVKRVVRIEVL